MRWWCFVIVGVVIVVSVDDAIVIVVQSLRSFDLLIIIGFARVALVLSVALAGSVVGVVVVGGCGGGGGHVVVDGMLEVPCILFLLQMLLLMALFVPLFLLMLSSCLWILV